MDIELNLDNKLVISLNIDNINVIDILYEYLDPLLNNKEYYRIETIINNILLFNNRRSKRVSTQLYIAILTLIHSKSNIRNKDKVINITKELLREENVSEKNIYSILKGF